MAYIGKAPGGTGVRQRYLYTATSGQTTFTTSDSGLALSYSDTNYMDVYQNGVLLDPANDYTATSGTSVVLGTGATTGDVIEIIVYDVFSVFNNTVTGNFTVGNNLTVSGTSTLATVDINAGNIDGTTIGAATPAAGNFTTGSFTGDVSFGDNDKAIFGTDSDLEIYHSGAGSFISDVGNGALHIRGTNLILQNGDGTKRFIDGNDGGAVEIHYGDATNGIKLATTSTGIDVTGTVTSDGLTVDGSVDVNGATSFNLQTTGTNYIFNRTDAAPVLATQYNGTTNAQFFTGTNGALSLRADPTDNLSGSYFDITVDGTTALTIDDSQNVGIGNSSPDTNLEISDTSGAVLRLSGHTGGAINVTPYDIGSIEFKSDDASGEGPRVVATVKTEADTASTVPGGELVFETRGPGNGTSLDERMRIDSSGNVGIGVTTPSTSLDVVRNGVQPLRVQNTSGTEVQINMVNTGGNVQLEAHSGNFNIDADKVGIGTTSPSSNAIVKFLEIQDSTSAGLVLDAARVFSIYSSTSSTLAFRDETASTNRMTIDSSGRVLIGADSGDAFNSDSSLRLQSSNNNYVQIKVPTNSQAGLLIGDTADDFAGGMIYNNSGDYLRFDSDNAERLRITGAQFMFGQTDSSPVAVISATGGDAIGINSSDGYVSIKRNAGAGLYINKTDSALSELIQFRQNGTKTGNIGYRGSGVVHIGAGDTGLEFHSADNRVYPTNPDTAALRDNAIDLGGPSYRFDDVYATNGTIQTSDQNEKQQIASLTDAEITAAKAISKLFKTFKWNDSVEEKGDAARTHAGVIAQDVQQAMTDAGLDASDYAFFISATWWETQTEVPAVEADEENGIEAADAYTRTDTYNTVEEAPEGATERTRMGIRYPELLAFIGAATEQRLVDIETRLTALEAN